MSRPISIKITKRPSPEEGAMGLGEEEGGGGGEVLSYRAASAGAGPGHRHGGRFRASISTVPWMIWFFRAPSRRMLASCPD